MPVYTPILQASDLVPGEHYWICISNAWDMALIVRQGKKLMAYGPGFTLDISCIDFRKISVRHVPRPYQTYARVKRANRSDV